MRLIFPQKLPTIYIVLCWCDSADSEIDTVELNDTWVRSVWSSDRAEPLSDKYSRTASENDHLAIACYTLTLIYTIIIDILVKINELLVVIRSLFCDCHTLILKFKVHNKFWTDHIIVLCTSDCPKIISTHNNYVA